MVSIARKNLFSEKTRFLVSVSGVAFSILLIVFLLGVYNAFKRILIDYVISWQADLVVAQEGVTDMSHTFSLLDEKKISQIESLTGGKAYGLVNRTVQVRVREEDGSKIIDYPGRKKGENRLAKKATIQLIGFDTKTGIGTPPVMLVGSNSPRKREIVVDRVFLIQNGLNLGDSIELSDEVFKIVGVTDKNNVMIYSRAFIDLEEAQELLHQRGEPNFILVALPDSSRAQEMADKLENNIAGITVYRRDVFADSNAQALMETFVPIIFIITIIGFITGSVVVGITIYTATMEKIKEYGVLKAIGASQQKLFFIVFEQAFWSSIAGYVIGIIFALIVARLSADYMKLLVYFTPQIYLLSFGAAIAMSAVATYIPMVRITKTDPAMVFRS